MSATNRQAPSRFRNGLLLLTVACTAACASPRPLTGTRWQLKSSDSVPAVAARLRQVHLLLQDSTGAVSGTGFCNRLRGQYHLDVRAQTLTFSNLQANWTACPDLVAETRFLDVLRQTDRYETKGRMLVLYRGTTRLLTFSGQP